MSRKERERLTLMVGIKRQELTLARAADLLGLRYRQTKRVWRRYQTEGDAGLVHRLRGQPSARRKPPALRARVLARHDGERYADFGPTLLAGHLPTKGWKVARGVAALAAGRRQAHGAPPPAEAPAIARVKARPTKARREVGHRRRAIRGGGVGWGWAGSIGVA